VIKRAKRARKKKVTKSSKTPSKIIQLPYSAKRGRGKVENHSLSSLFSFLKFNHSAAALFLLRLFFSAFFGVPLALAAALASPIVATGAIGATSSAPPLLFLPPAFFFVSGRSLGTLGGTGRSGHGSRRSGCDIGVAEVGSGSSSGGLCCFLVGALPAGLAAAAVAPGAGAAAPPAGHRWGSRSRW